VADDSTAGDRLKYYYTSARLLASMSMIQFIVIQSLCECANAAQYNTEFSRQLALRDEKMRVDSRVGYSKNESRYTA